MGYLDMKKNQQIYSADPFKDQSYPNASSGGPDFSQAYTAMPSAPVSAPASKASGPDAASLGTAAASGATVGGPWGAGVAVAGSLLSNYLAQAAANEQQKRQLLSQVYQKQGTDESNIINNIMQNNARALR